MLLTTQREKEEEKLRNVAGSEADISCLLTPDPVLNLQATAHLGANAPLSHSWVPFCGQLYVDSLTIRKKEEEQLSTQQVFMAIPWCAEAYGCVWKCLPYKGTVHCSFLLQMLCWTLEWTINRDGQNIDVCNAKWCHINSPIINFFYIINNFCSTHDPFLWVTTCTGGHWYLKTV